MNASNAQDKLHFAQQKDELDPLRDYRDQFFIPNHLPDQKQIYLLGHSLGLQPQTVPEALEKECQNWAERGCAAHFQNKTHPWFDYHQCVTEPLAQLVGALPHEVVATNSLTVNLHLMMVSFFKPTAQRYKIVVEKDIFPSDYYAVQSQLIFHGLDPNTALLKVDYEEIPELLAQQGEEVALVLLSAVNYATGYWCEMAHLTACAHRAGAMVGFDCAHAVGNVPLALHEWGVDFAVWCSYKYLNAGPGAIGGLYVHEQHGQQTQLLRFAGWWGHQASTRFETPETFNPIQGAEGWQLSNPNIFSLAALKASLELFQTAQMSQLRQKSMELIQFCLELLEIERASGVRLLTSMDPQHRGSMICLELPEAQDWQLYLNQRGIACDLRHHTILRVSFVPLYNTFKDVYHFVSCLQERLSN